MKLGEKIRYLREVEGTLRGLGRAMTQQEVVDAIRERLHKHISQSYLSQIESGARPHLTNSSRMLLAKFFNVHPGYLVDDPEGYHTELQSDLRAAEDKLDLVADQRRRAVSPRSGSVRGAAGAWRATRIRASACCCWRRFWTRRTSPSGCCRCCGRKRRNTGRETRATHAGRQEL